MLVTIVHLFAWYVLWGVGLLLSGIIGIAIAVKKNDSDSATVYIISSVIIYIIITAIIALIIIK